MKTGLRLYALPLVLFVNGCAIHKYHPVPVSTAATLKAFEAKSLTDPALRQFIETNERKPLPHWPLSDWDLETLTLASYYYSPELDEARAQAATAQAAVITAGARPNPTIGIGGGSSSSPESPYLWSVDLSIPFETAGKRGYRVMQTKDLAEASRFALGESAWKVRAKVRAALLDYLTARMQLAAAESEEQTRARYVGLLQRRVQAGEIARPDVNAALLDLTQTRISVRALEGTLQANLVTLAAAIGVPASELQAQHFVWKDMEHLPEIPVSQLRHEAALNRLDLQQALSEYKAEDANLRLQIAKQYPDVQVGPQADHQEGFNNYSLGISVELPLLNHNEGPIAEAEAARNKAAAHLRALQANAIAEVNAADASYRAAIDQLAHTDSELETVQHQALRRAQLAVLRGEEDRTFAAAAAIQTAVISRARVDALHNAQVALGSLEEAVEKPLTAAADAPSPVPTMPSQPESRGKR